MVNVNRQPGLIDIPDSACRPAARLVAAGRALRLRRRDRESGMQERVARYPIVAALLIAVASCGSSPSSPTSGAAQAVYYVSPTGHDQDGGTITAPFQTISAGLKRLRPGDTLYIRGGIYTGSANTIDSQSGTVPSGSSWSNAITIAGYQGEAVTLRPPYNVSGIRLTATQSYLIFQDFTIDMVNSNAGADADGIFVFRPHHNRFQRLEVMHSYNFGIHFGDSTANNEVIDCRIHDNGFPGSPSTNGHGLYITGSDNLFQNNEVYDNQGYGFHVYNNAGSHADPSRNIVRGNRIHGNGRHGGTAYGVLVAWGDANEIASNQIFDNPGGIQIYTNSTNTSVHDNNIYNNKPLEGIIVQYSSGTKLANNTATANGSDVVDLGTETAFRQNSFQAPVRPGVR